MNKHLNEDVLLFARVNKQRITVRSQSRFVFNFARNYQTIFRVYCKILCFSQKYVGVINTQQYTISLFYLTTLVSLQSYLIVLVIYILLVTNYAYNLSVDLLVIHLPFFVEFPSLYSVSFLFLTSKSSSLSTQVLFLNLCVIVVSQYLIYLIISLIIYFVN